MFHRIRNAWHPPWVTMNMISSLALIAAHAFGAPPVVLIVSLSKSTYRTGEQVEVTVKLANVSQSPVIISTVGTQYYPHATLSFKACDSSGKPLMTDRGGSQSVVSNEITPDIFTRIAPGAV